jgi:hypothetical protein
MALNWINIDIILGSLFSQHSVLFFSDRLPPALAGGLVLQNTSGPRPNQRKISIILSALAKARRNSFNFIFWLKPVLYLNANHQLKQVAIYKNS